MKKVIMGIILFTSSVIATVYAANIGGNKVCLGEWILSKEYIPSNMGFTSRLASADDLVGEKLKIYEDNDELICEWDGHIYNLQESASITMDKVTFAKRYAVYARLYLDNFSFPVKRFVFENEKLEMPTVNLLMDSDNKIFIRFNDQIGDLAIFPLEKE